MTFTSKELATAIIEVALMHEESFGLNVYEQDIAANGFASANYYHVSINTAGEQLYSDNPSLRDLVVSMLHAAWNDSIEWANKEKQNSACTA